MNKTFTFLAVAALVSGSNLALAQSLKSSCADTFAEMQALSSNSSQWHPTEPSVGREGFAPRLHPASKRAGSSTRPLADLWTIERSRVQAAWMSPSFFSGTRCSRFQC